MAEFPGHRGQLVIGSTVVTDLEGATINYNPQTAEWGGWGSRHRKAKPIMPGAPTIEVENPVFDPSVTVVRDLFETMRSGGDAVCYLYPNGQDDQTFYHYGNFVLDDLSQEMSIEDLAREPFSLIASNDVYEVGM